MSVTLQCPECRRSVRPSVLGGLCPACVTRCSLGIQRVVAIADSPIANRLAPTEPLLPRKLRVGDYEIESEIARGGMGVVYRARQVGLNRRVALKLLLAGQFADAGQVKRFRAEAAAVARLEHPAIVPVYEVGEFEGRHFFSMRLIEGPSLSAAMERLALPAAVRRAEAVGQASKATVRLLQRELASFMAVVARAVHYAHQRGVLHRDLKPGNVLLDSQGRPHITDFGLARFMDSDARVTGSGMVFGTPAYMPPEQTVDPHNVSVAADVYSLGAITYELLTGRPPFEAGTPVETVIQVRDKDPIRPRDLEPSVDRDLETIVLKCLDKNPATRYGTAAALAEDLERFVAGEPVQARPVSSSVRLFRWARRRPAVAALVTTVVLLLVGLAIGGPATAYVLGERSRVNSELTKRYLGELRSSRVAQAGSERLRGEAAHRETGLEAVKAATEAGVNLPILNEAVAQLARYDVSGSVHPLLAPESGYSTVCRPDFSVYYQTAPEGVVRARLTADNSTVWVRTNLHSKRPGFLTVSPDSRFLAFAREDRLTILRTEDGSEVWTVPMVNFSCFNPDGSWLLMQDRSREYRRLETATGRQLPFSREFRWTRTEFVLNPDPECPVLARLWGAEIQFFDWEKNQVGESLRHSSALQSIVWQDNRIAASDHSDGVVVWVLPSRRPLLLRERIPEIESLRFIPNSPLLLVTSKDGRVSCWNTDEGERVFSLNGALPRQVSADGTQILMSSAQEGELWITRLLLPAGRVRFRFEDGEDSTVRQVSFSPDARFLAVVKQAGVYFLDLTARQEPAFLPHFGALTCSFLRESNTCVVQGRQRIQWLELTPTGVAPSIRVRASREWDDGAIRESAAVDLVGDTLLIPRSNFGLEFLRLSDGATVGSIPAADLGVTSSLDRHADWIVCRKRKAPPVLIGADGKIPPQPPFTDEFVPRFSPDGRWLLASSRAAHRIYSATNWMEQPRTVLAGTERRDPPPAAWFRDSRWVAVCNGFDQIVIWDTVAEKDVIRLTTPFPARFTALASSPGGRWLAAGNDRGSVELWDLVELNSGLKTIGLGLAQRVSSEEMAMEAIRWRFERAKPWLPEPERSGVIPRDAAAGPSQIDLTAFYNARLDKSWTLLDSDSTRDSLVSFPAGLRRHDGVLFDARGVIQFFGERFRTQPSPFRSKIEGIPVAATLRHVHLLAAAVDAPSSVPRGTELGRVRLNYTDGSFAELPLILGIHLEDHMIPVTSSRRPEKSRVAWWGLTGGTETQVPPRVEMLYHVELENPHPEREVTTMDLISANGLAAPFVVAITVE